jgi:hypothetical protein
MVYLIVVLRVLGRMVGLRRPDPELHVVSQHQEAVRSLLESVEADD